MTIEPKEINKVADKATGKKKPATGRKPKSINELPVVRKKLRETETRASRAHAAGSELIKATKKFERALESLKPAKSTKPAKRAAKKGK